MKRDQPNSFDPGTSATAAGIAVEMVERSVVIDYVNWRGERSTRIIMPIAIRFGSNEWHPEPQWLLDAHDFDKGGERTFAMRDIHFWRKPEGETP